MTILQATRLVMLVSYFSLMFVVLASASNDEVGAIIRNLFETGKVETGSAHLNERMKELEAFYQARSYKPIWVRDDGPKGKAKALLVELNRSVVHGLDPEYYRTKTLTSLMGSTNPDELASLEMLFSGALIDYGYDLSNGHVDYNLAPKQVQIVPIIRSITEVLDGAEQAGNLREFVSSLLNVDDRYVRLLTKIAEINRASASDLWPGIPADIPELELGNRHPAIVNIRTYLMLMGDYIAADFTTKEEFDRPLQQALMSFQSRQGFETSGKLDRQTLDEIAVPIEKVVEKISINLERRRWQNREIGQKHVYMNLSDNQGRLVVDGEKAEEFELVKQESDAGLPTHFGTITHLAKSGSGDGLQLTIQSTAPDNLPQISADIVVLGNPQELADRISGEAFSFSEDGEPVALMSPINTFVTYVTAWANKDGSVHFRNDRHGRDEQLNKYLTTN